MSWIIVQTEKAYTLESKNVYILANFNKNHKTNKIELAKVLNEKGCKVVDINSTKSYIKQKKRGKKRNIVNQFRPRKWYVTLEAGHKITEEVISKMNQ